MAPARKKRQNEYFDVGVQGRRTGITLPENTRDSFGVENIDGVFSSPEKSPAKRVPIHGNTTLSSIDMEVADDSAPEPSQVLNSRKLLRSTKSSLPPPSGRSPFKTNIGSSPRRRSSVAPQTASNSVTRKLNFRADEPRPSIEGPDGSSSARRGRRINGSDEVYEMRPSPPSNKRSRDEMEDDLEIGRDAQSFAVPEDSVAFLNGDYDDVDMEPADQETEFQGINGEVQSSPIIRKKRRTNGIDSSMVNGHYLDYDIQARVEQESSIKPPSLKRKVGRPRKSNVSVVEEEGEESQTEALSQKPTKASKSRKEPVKPASKAKAKDKEAMPPPAIKPRGRSTATDSSLAPTSEEPEVFKKPSKPNKRTKKTNSRVLADKDPNTSAPNSNKSLWSQPSTKPRARSLQIMDHEPIRESSLVTRSGRRSIRPLEHWRNEQVQYTWDGEAIDVLRAPSEEPTTKPKSKRRGSKRAKRSGLEAIPEDDVELEAEEWEAEGEILTGLVKEWDNEQGIQIEEDYVSELAHGANSVITRDVVGAAFRYGKILNLPFLGAGIVEIPPNGYKREKNSRKMHMIFFIETGKVDVTVGDNSFTITKGGCWQVPRGNNYSIENPGDQEARLFFAQACERVLE